MATPIEGLDLPPGYGLWEADEADPDPAGTYWYTVAGACSDSFETEAGAREDLWQHRAEQLADALREVRDLTANLLGDTQTPTFGKVHAIASRLLGES